jgi:hypothetical protein
VGWNAGAWVLAAAGLGVGSYVLLSHPVSEHTSITLAPSGTTAGLGLSGTF